MLLHDGEEYVLTTLDQTNVERSLDIHFSQGEKVCLFLKGEGTIHLTGYIVDFGDEDEDYSDDENPFVSVDEFAKAANKRGLQQNGNGLTSKKIKLLNEDENDDENESEDDEDEDYLGDLDEEFGDFDEMDDEEGDDDDDEEESDADEDIG